MNVGRSACALRTVRAPPRRRRKMVERESGSEPESGMFESEYPLHYACWRGSVADVQMALYAGEDVNKENTAMLDFGPLRYWQTVCGKDEFVCRFEECTPLHVAVYFRRAAVVALLLRSGADVERRAHKILFGTYNDEDEIDMSEKWLYRDVSCLHLAVGGEECVPAKVEDLHQTLHHLVHHIRSLAHGTGGGELDEAWSPERVRALVDGRASAIEWWYRAEPQYELHDVAPLYVAIFHQTHLQTHRGTAEAEALVGLLHASRRADLGTIHHVSGVEHVIAEGMCARTFGAGMECMDWDLALHEAYRLCREEAIGEVCRERRLPPDLVAVVLAQCGEPGTSEVAEAVAHAEAATREDWLACEAVKGRMATWGEA